MSVIVNKLVLFYNVDTYFITINILLKHVLCLSESMALDYCMNIVDFSKPFFIFSPDLASAHSGMETKWLCGRV